MMHFLFFSQKIIILGFNDDLRVGDPRIVRGQGYVRVLVGRARSDMLRVTPRLTPRLTQPKNFCTTRLLFENRLFVDFSKGNEDYGGDLEENGCFP